MWDRLHPNCWSIHYSPYARLGKKDEYIQGWLRNNCDLPDKICKHRCIYIYLHFWINSRYRANGERRIWTLKRTFSKSHTHWMHIDWFTVKGPSISYGNICNENRIHQGSSEWIQKISMKKRSGINRKHCFCALKGNWKWTHYGQIRNCIVCSLCSTYPKKETTFSYKGIIIIIISTDCTIHQQTMRNVSKLTADSKTVKVGKCEETRVSVRTYI